MRILLTAESKQSAAASLRFLDRLKLPNAEIEIVHVLQWMAPPPVDVNMLSTLDGYYRLREEEIRESLSEVQTMCAERSIKSELTLLYGFTVRELVAHADAVGPGLIVAAASGESVLDRMATGSVTRGLCAHAKQSMLVVKDGTETKRPLRAVFATDHSAYMEKACGLLMQIVPRGLAHLSIITVIPEHERGREVALSPHRKIDLETLLKDDITEKNDLLAQRLDALCPEITFDVLTGDPYREICTRAAMENADLVIVGAKGHGMFDRLTLGSVSYQLIANAPQSVLVLRP